MFMFMFMWTCTNNMYTPSHSHQSFIINRTYLKGQCDSVTRCWTLKKTTWTPYEQIEL